MKPDVSIIIPVFNKAAYLRQCLQSTLGQSLRSIEIICIDDASTDASVEILREAADQDCRIRLLFNPLNLGAGATRNRGLEAAKGRFVRIVDADDLLPERSTETMLRRAMVTGADLVRGGLIRFSGDDPANVILNVKTSDRIETTFASDPDLWVPWWHTSYLFANDFIQNCSIRYPDLRRGEDPVFMAEALVNSRSASIVEDVVYLYRSYPKATGAAGTSFTDVIDSLHHAARVKALFMDRHPPAWTEEYGQYLLADFHKYLGRCVLNGEQADFVNAEAREIWGEGLLVVNASSEELQCVSSADTGHSEKVFWNQLFKRRDPWKSASAYEQTKYHHTLEIMPSTRARKALEIGCAEGVFTSMVGSRVDRLLSIDISRTALMRARHLVADESHIRFLEIDVADAIPGDGYDLIICSEILYYLRDRSAVEAFARRVRDCLALGGHLVMTHANMVSDDPDDTGFDFNEIGAKFIGGVFARCPGLVFQTELRTELYSVQHFRREAANKTAISAAPREVLVRQYAPFQHPSIKWGGCAVTAAEARHLWRVGKVPVLMYHRIADDGPEGLAPYRLSPAKFERQLAWLARHGWHGMDLSSYCKLRFSEGRRELRGKPVVLTFDDAYADFYDAAWPLLRKYGFAATVFVPVDFVGGVAEWDLKYGAPARLMTWEQIQELHVEGVAFGSHSCRHKPVTTLSSEELLADGLRSMQVIEGRIGAKVSGYCYPYGISDERCRQIIEKAGYAWAVSVTGGKPPDYDDPFRIPRIEVFGGDDLDAFIRNLPVPDSAPEAERQRYFELRARRDRATYMNR